MCTRIPQEKAQALRRQVLMRCLAALALAGSVAAGAGSLSVAPLRLTFTPAAGIATVTVENTGREETLVQTETFAWNQQGNEHKLTPTDDVVAVPPVFRLAPGGQQQVRVGLTRAFGEGREQTFRLTVTEVPTAVASGTVAVAVRHSLPIFVLPASPISPNLTVTRRTRDGLEIANTGSRHLRIDRWRLRDDGGVVVAGDAGPGYLLAGASHFLAAAGAGFKGSVLFEADSDSRTFKISVGE